MSAQNIGEPKKKAEDVTLGYCIIFWSLFDCLLEFQF